MKKPKVPEIKMPYASTIASFFGDQGSVQGNSFLGRLFKGGGRTVINQSQGKAAPAPRASATLSNGAIGRPAGRPANTNRS